MISPHPFQEADQEVLARNNWTALVPIETGGGKTVLAALAIRNSGAAITLVIAPNNTLQNAWIPTIREIVGVEARIAGNKRKAHRDALTDFQLGMPGVYLMSHQFVTRADIRTWYGDMLIVDEVHKMSRAGSAGQRKLSGYSRDDGLPLSGRFTHKLAMSGTPFRNSFERAWGVMRFLWPELNGVKQVATANYYSWLYERMTHQDIVTGKDKKGNLKTAKKWLKERQPGRLMAEAPCVIQHFRRTKCCEFHPHGFLPMEAPQVIRRVVELDPKQKKAIEQLEKHYMTWLDNLPLSADLTITQKQRIRQVCLGVPTLEVGFDANGNDVTTVDFAPDCVSPFYDELLDILEETAPEPVAVYMESQKFARTVTQKLNADGIPSFEFSGKTVATRDQDLAEFGDKFRVLVGVISSVGEGTDGIQRVCSTDVFLEQSVDETLNTQVQARTDRLGAKGQVQRFVILDDMGHAEGAMEKRLKKARELQMSVRRAV